MAAQKKPARRVFIRLDLDREDHQAVRLAAARVVISMAEFARQAVIQAARRVNRPEK
jgi:predicted HicB family RNase H-like nuclease